MKFTIFISVFALSVLISVLFSKFLNDAYNEKAFNQKVDSVEAQCRWLANQVVGVDFILNDSSNALSSQTNELAASMNGRIIIIKKNYKIIKDTHTDFQEKYFLNNDVLRIMEGREERIVNEEGDYIEIMCPIYSAGSEDGEVLGAVIATVPRDDLMAAGIEMEQRRNMLLVAFIIVGLTFSVILSYLLTRDLKKIQHDVNFIAMGHEDETIREVGFLEIRRIVSRFNEILGRMQVLEDSRKEFVSNVSHELKTPMTSMKVLADSLLQQGDQVPAELYREFMSDMVKEIDRENVIISDLLSLVKMDKKASKLEISNVDINELLQIIMKRLKPIAAQRNIELIFESFRPVTAEIDEVKLTLALSNLIENGIKYNKDNGYVRVSVNADHKYFYVKVADNGVGIPEDCQDRVFDRFFRVDKARSRDTGGTGLGLSITQNAVLMHKGEIKLYSRLGEGTTFTVRIPLKYNA